MGCCLSSASRKEQEQEPHLSTENFPTQSCGSEGPEVGLSVAYWGRGNGFYKVLIGTCDILAAIFDSPGSAGADICCESILQDWENVRHLPPADALGRVLLKVQRKTASKLGRQCTVNGVLLYCHKQSQKVHMVRRGSATAAIGELVHGLNLQVTTGKLPFTCDTWRTASADYETGLGALEYSELQLIPIHEHIILGTSQFWAYISPDDAVLRSHLYLKSHVEGPDEILPNSAAHLTYFAISKRSRSIGLPEGSGAIVLTLRWPSTSFNQAFGDKPWLKQLIEQEHETASMRAIKRWQQLKVLYIEYTHSYRLMMLKKWYEATEKLMAAGTRRARQVEEAFWKTNQMVVIATPSLKVRETDGRILGKEEVQAVMKTANQIFELDAYY